MYLVTTLTYDELSTLIRDKRVSLDNGQLLFDRESSVINEYFKDRIGSSGYVLGLRGRINKTTANVFAAMDRKVLTGEKIIIETEVNPDDMIRFNVAGVTSAAEAVTYGLDKGDIVSQLDSAQTTSVQPEGVEVVCIPYLKANGKLRVTSVTDNLEFNVEGISFVRVT